MGTAKLISLLDTHVDQSQPLTNYNLGGSLYIRQWSGSIRVGYLYFSRPFPLGATITSAKLHLYGYAKPVSGTIQMYLRRLNQTISYSKVNWNSRATAFYAGEVYSSKSGTYPDRTEYVFDITTLMQPVADGDKWYGLQLGSDWTATTWSPRFMSSNHPNPDLRPWVEIEWSDAPDTPTQLSPSSGNVVSVNKPILRFDYTDVSGDTELAEAQVQVHTSATFTSPTYDSGWTAVESPQWDLTPTAFTATAGTTYYWRVRVRDGAGVMSGWSAAASFVYRALPTLTIDSPALPPNNYVEEPTPPITWTVTGTQQSYQLGIWRWDGAKWILLWSRPRTVTATTDGFVVPAGVITVKAATYRVDVRVYDSYVRESVPNGKAYAQLSREFTYQFSAVTSPVTSLTGTPANPYPGVLLQWQRATMPDSYSIIRDGKIIAAGLDPDDDTFVSGTSYEWRDVAPVKDAAHVYSVQPIVNGKASSANPTVTVTNRFQGTWITDAVGGSPVAFFQDQGRTMAFGEQSEVFEPIGAESVAVITQGMRGYEGQVDAQIWDNPVGLPVSIGTWKANFLTLKSLPGQKIYLFTDDFTIPIVIQNANLVHLPGPEGTGYAISFQFFQTGDLTYVPQV